MLVKLVGIPDKTKPGNVVQVAEFHYAGKAWQPKEYGIGRFKASEASCPWMNNTSEQTTNRR